MNILYKLLHPIWTRKYILNKTITLEVYIGLNRYTRYYWGYTPTKEKFNERKKELIQEAKHKRNFIYE